MSYRVRLRTEDMSRIDTTHRTRHACHEVGYSSYLDSEQSIRLASYVTRQAYSVLDEPDPVELELSLAINVVSAVGFRPMRNRARGRYTSESVVYRNASQGPPEKVSVCRARQRPAGVKCKADRLPQTAQVKPVRIEHHLALASACSSCIFIIHASYSRLGV